MNILPTWLGVHIKDTTWTERWTVSCDEVKSGIGNFFGFTALSRLSNKISPHKLRTIWTVWPRSSTAHFNTRESSTQVIDRAFINFDKFNHATTCASTNHGAAGRFFQPISVRDLQEPITILHPDRVTLWTPVCTSAN